MGARRLCAVVAVGVLVGALLGLGLPSAPASHAAAGVTVVSDETVSASGRLHHLTLQSAVMGDTQPVRVLLPPGYDDPANASKRYPVLYLLHGADLNATSWSEPLGPNGFTGGGQVADVIKDTELIVVMPDGGDHGFYSDWQQGPQQWESYHIGELLPWVDNQYRTVGTRESRAIAGLSMGGYGAMIYAARHPDLFVAAASFSGAVDNVTGAPAGFALIHLAMFEGAKRWGAIDKDEVVWRDHNPSDLAPNLHTTKLALWVGKGVPDPANGDFVFAGPFESGVFLMNTTAHQRLTAEGVAHEYYPEVFGTHEWPYHRKHLTAWLPSLLATFADPPPLPAGFDYRSAEASFSVWDWTFTADRAVNEFAEVRNVQASGLTATGSGRLDVVTAPHYEPGAAYLVDESTVVADGTDRLSFPIDLGPSHDTQQYTLEANLAELAAGAGYFTTRTVTITKVAVAPSPNPPAAEVSPAAASRTDPVLPRTGAHPPTLLAGALFALALLARSLARTRRTRPRSAGLSASRCRTFDHMERPATRRRNAPASHPPRSRRQPPPM